MADDAVVLANLAQVLRDAKAFSPRLNRYIRRSLREATNLGTREMKKILDEYEGGTSDRPGSGNLAGHARQEVASGLRARITSTPRKTSVSIRATKGDLRRALNVKNNWRHPVFGNRSVFVSQPGDSYFTRGSKEVAEDARAGLAVAINEAIVLMQEAGVTGY